MSAAELLQVVRDHLKVENQLHWVLDAAFGEDGHQLQVGYGSDSLTALRKLVHALVKNSKSEHGIKGTREMAGWDTNVLERILHEAGKALEIRNA